MKKLFYASILLITSITTFSQSKIDKLRDATLMEGKKLYESEMASWYGTDIFMENYPIRESVGGYFSYSDKEVAKCIFFSKDEKPKVIGTISFDKTFAVKNANLDLVERDFTSLEQDLYTLRKNALVAINSDTIFKYYPDTNFNLVPLISNGDKKVYVLTGSTKNGVVIFGNDYLLTFDKKGTFKKTTKLHAGMIRLEYENFNGDANSKTTAAMHTHLPEYSEIMTATDICTTMLYEKFTDWESNIVISKKYVSLWDCKSDQFVVMTMEAWEKMFSNQSEE